MPEGHVIHRLADGLTEAFGGCAVRVSSPQGRFAEEAALLDGQVLRGQRRTASTCSSISGRTGWCTSTSD